jgi:hypothetical protein
MSNEKRRSSNIGDLLKRKSSLLNTSLDVNILDEIENVVLAKTSKHAIERPGATRSDKASKPSVRKSNPQKAISPIVKSAKVDDTVSNSRMPERTNAIKADAVFLQLSQCPPLTAALTGHLALISKVSLDRAMYYLMLKELAENGLLSLSQVRIARILNASEITIKRTLKELEDVGLLIRTNDHSAQQARTYRFSQ